MTHRSLTQNEIKTLETGRCSCEDWTRVRVAEGFDPLAIRAASFSGDIRLGRFEGRVSLPGGLSLPSGIENAALHNCTVGDGGLIRNIGRHISNYNIGDGVVIDGVGLLAVEGDSTFGNGVRVAALNEMGGREVPIFDRLTSQIAYMLALYRHRPDVIENLESAIARYVEQVRCARGSIGDGALIESCATIRNVRVGPSAQLSGALKLKNGTVNSSPEDPALVGHGVIATDFIICSGSHVEDSAILSDTFVGQGVRMGRQIAAENCLFFANCEALHGETCSVFAGPYTVTHHKSSLLIAGLFSFYNAGSGTNMSNHMYKLGPLLQGLMERGGKTGSSAYLLWSSRVGAFSVVIGKHYAKFDTSDFPFSYIVESDEKSVLIPAVNLATVGTWRDGAKWPKRDRRRDPDRLDLIHFDILSPYTVAKMIRGRQILRELDAQTPSDEKQVEHQGVRIPRSRFQKGEALYDLGIKIYLGGKIASRLEKIVEQGGGKDHLGALLKTKAEGRSASEGPWTDLSGLLTPLAKIDQVLARIAEGKMPETAILEADLTSLHAGYRDMEWTWVRAAWLLEIDKTPENVTLADVAEAVREWRDATLKRNELVLADARKEFEGDAQITYGIDGDSDAARADFKAVRGTFDGNSFVREVNQNSEETTALAQKIVSAIE